jgi:hypothetical protein
VLGGPGEDGALQQRGDAAAAPVGADGGEAVLSPIGVIDIANEPGHADKLSVREREERPLRPNLPLA